MTKKKDKFNLTDKELKSLHRTLFDWNGVGGLIINKDMLKEICSELVELRQVKKDV